jgi:hypothetical protein
MTKLTTFHNRGVIYVETMQVKDGVECDVYAFEGDDSEDLAIVRVTKGFKTPLQKILQGDKTIEGYLDGEGALTVQHEDSTIKTYSFDAKSTDNEVEVQVGQIMQWAAPHDTDLTFYEICTPPYKDGRFENLAEEV